MKEIGARVPRSLSGLRLRIRAHPGADRAPRTLVTVPIRQVRMEAGLVPLPYGKHRPDHILYSRTTPRGIRIGGGGADRVRILPLDWGIVRGLSVLIA